MKNANKGSLAHLYKCKFVYSQKEKMKIGKFTVKLTVLWYDKKPTSMQRNYMAAIPKMLNFSLELGWKTESREAN